MKTALFALLLASALSLPRPSTAASQRKSALAETSTHDDTFGHGQQFGLRMGLVAGYRIIARYDGSPYCTDPDPAVAPREERKFCGHPAPLALDFGLSFAPFDSIEPFVWARLGLSRESETNTDAVLLLGAGARIYTMSDSALKIYIEPAVGVELEAGGDDAAWNDLNAEYESDFVLHLAAGPQLDLAKNFGIYADAGITSGILRAFHGSLELKVGVQGRLP